MELQRDRRMDGQSKYLITLTFQTKGTKKIAFLFLIY